MSWDRLICAFLSFQSMSLSGLARPAFLLSGQGLSGTGRPGMCGGFIWASMASVGLMAWPGLDSLDLGWSSRAWHYLELAWHGVEWLASLYLASPGLVWSGLACEICAGLGLSGMGVSCLTLAAHVSSGLA